MVAACFVQVPSIGLRGACCIAERHCGFVQREIVEDALQQVLLWDEALSPAQRMLLATLLATPDGRVSQEAIQYGQIVTERFTAGSTGDDRRMSTGPDGLPASGLVAVKDTNVLGAHSPGQNWVKIRWK